MSNPLTQISPEHAAALEITLAMIAKTEFGAPFNVSDGQDKKGTIRAEHVNVFFNSVLQNLKAQS